MGAELDDGVRALAWGSRLLERSCTNLSLPQYRVLALVASSPERASRVAHRAAVTRSTLTALLDGLETRGFVRRSDVEGDRRGVLLEVTAEGRDALRRAEFAMGQRLAEVLGHTPDAPAVLAALRALLEAMDTERRSHDDRDVPSEAGLR